VPGFGLLEDRGAFEDFRGAAGGPLPQPSRFPSDWQVMDGWHVGGGIAKALRRWGMVPVMNEPFPRPVPDYSWLFARDDLGNRWRATWTDATRDTSLELVDEVVA
jgi:hypothetical protein